MTGTTREILIIPEYLIYLSVFVEVHFQILLHSITFFCTVIVYGMWISNFACKSVHHP